MLSSSLCFCMKDSVRIVYGASRAAIYNFKTGNVFSLNKTARRIMEMVENSQPVRSMGADSIAFLDELAELELGYFSDTPQVPIDNTIQPPLAIPLRFIWLELTETCNLRCVHCYANSGPERVRTNKSQNSFSDNPVIPLEISSIEKQTPSTTSSRYMAESDWKKVIREAAELGCHHVQFIGGEPLLYQPLLRLIDEAKMAGYSFIEIFTNGTLLTERMVQTLSQRDVHIAISLHSSRPEVQDQIAQQKDAFERAYRGLQLLKEFQVPTRIATTVLGPNQDDLEGIAQLAESMQVNSYSYDVVRAVGRGKAAHLSPSKASTIRSKWLLEPDFFTSYDSYLHNKGWHSCWAGIIAVGNQGQVTPCVFSRDQIVGNVFESSLADLLDDQQLRQLWGVTKDQIEVCRDCEYRYACGDCRPLAVGETGKLYGKYPRCTYDPYSGKWNALDEIYEKIDLVPELGPILELVTNPTSSRQKKDHIRFKCDPEGGIEPFPEIKLATNESVSTREKWQRFNCDPK